MRLDVILITFCPPQLSPVTTSLMLFCWDPCSSLSRILCDYPDDGVFTSIRATWFLDTMSSNSRSPCYWFDQDIGLESYRSLKKSIHLWLKSRSYSNLQTRSSVPRLFNTRLTQEMRRSVLQSKKLKMCSESSWIPSVCLWSISPQGWNSNNLVLRRSTLSSMIWCYEHSHPLWTNSRPSTLRLSTVQLLNTFKLKIYLNHTSERSPLVLGFANGTLTWEAKLGAG